MITVGSLFSGIGGLDLGLERAGMQVRWQCEIDPYCRAVLRHHWPNVQLYGDIHDIDESAPAVDLICGGFPCQPVSQAAARSERGEGWLWPEMLRVIDLLRPKWVVVENPEALRFYNRGLFVVLRDLASIGFDADWSVIQASEIGAPHKRARLWVVAYANGNWKPVFPIDAETSFLSELDQIIPDWSSPGSLQMADGVSNRVAQLRALGNAVVPQVAEFVGRLIVEADAR